MIPQEKDTYCVCAVLQDIFSDYGIVKSQDDIAKNLSPSDKGFYVDDENIKKFLWENSFRYSYFPYNATPFNEPDSLLKEMNNNSGFFGIGNHTYKISDFIDPELKFINPLDCSENVIDVFRLMKKMKENFGFFGLIEKLK